MQQKLITRPPNILNLALRPSRYLDKLVFVSQSALVVTKVKHLQQALPDQGWNPAYQIWWRVLNQLYCLDLDDKNQDNS